MSVHELPAICSSRIAIVTFEIPHSMSHLFEEKTSDLLATLSLVEEVPG